MYRRNDSDGNPTGEVLLVVGGVWDRLANKGAGGYTSDRPKRCKTWGVNPSQLAAVDALGTWFVKRKRGDASRGIIQSLAGPRGGGKTDFLVKAAAAFNIEFPGSKAWIFNPTLDKREEVEDMWRQWVPQSWAMDPRRWPTSVPDCRFRLINGSSTRSLSGEVPGSAKRGEAEFIGLNEAQQQRRKVFTLALYGIRKLGGLLVAAHNPPEETFPAGEWVVDLVEKIEAGRIKGSNQWIDPARNPSVDSATMAAIGEAISEVDPTGAAGDVKGQYRRLGDFVYSRFRPAERIVDVECPVVIPATDSEIVTDDGVGRVHGVRDDGRLRVVLPSMVREPPDIGREITAEALGKARAPARSVVIGTDHQTHPHQAAAAVKVYPEVDRHGRTTGKYIYWVVDEIIVSGSSVTETDLSDALYAGDGAAQVEYRPGDVLLVPDCSSDWQVSNRDAATTSLKVMTGLGWTCRPPTEIQRPDRSKHSKNPPVHHSIAQMADVMREGRFFVAPWCEWVIASGPKVPWRRDGDAKKISQRGGYAHVWDCIRYVVWLLEPKRKRMTRSTASPSAASFPGMRPGANFRL